jgi:hypothetical protein
MPCGRFRARGTITCLSPVEVPCRPGKTGPLCDRAVTQTSTIRAVAGHIASCTHDQGLRDKLPSFEGLPERYVVWGEGTTDEMCLGIVMVTRP